MARKKSSVKPATFALALSTLDPAWAQRLKTPNEVDQVQCKSGFFKRSSACQSANGVFATVLCLIGLSI